MRAIVQTHFDFIWRSLRRLGVAEADVDDCAQKVFLVAARKLASIEVGCERSYLFGTAMRTASDERRKRGRSREVATGDEPGAELSDPGPSPEQLADDKRARARLDEVLEELPLDLRAVFVLFELEEMKAGEIASLLQIPTGTVASRLRRGREEFQRVVARLQAREKFRGGAT